MSKKLETAGGQVSPITNIGLMHTTLEALTKRAPGLPGIGVFYGPSGVGKSFGAAYGSHPNTFNAIYVACRSFEGRRSFVEQVCKAIGIKARGSIADVVEEIVQVLVLSGRPLIVDEVDHIAESKTLELIRDLHDGAQSAVLLIGEEKLPSKLAQHERFDNRVLVWQPAAVCSAQDFDRLAQQYAAGIGIDPAMKTRILTETRAITRRVVVNLEGLRRWCGQKGTQVVPADADVAIYTGAAPGRRVH